MAKKIVATDQTRGMGDGVSKEICGTVRLPVQGRIQDFF